jgi:hypothetical protein
MQNIRLNSLNRMIYSTTQPSTNISSGSMIINGGLSIGCTTNSLSVTSGGAVSIAGGASISKDVRVGSDIYVNNNVISGSGTLGHIIMLQTAFVDVTVGSFVGYTASNTILFREPGNPGINGAIGSVSGFGSGNLSDGSNDNISWNYARLVIRGSSLYTGNSSSNIVLSPFIVQSTTGTMYTQSTFNVTDNGSDNGYSTWISPWINTTAINDIQSIGIKASFITTGNSITTGNVRIGPSYLQFKA